MGPTSQAIARARIFSARHSWFRWSVVALLAVAAGFATHQQLVAVDAERAAWGDTVDVVVATRDLAPGEALATELVAVPRAVAPPAALSAIPDAARLRQRVMHGEILTHADVTSAPGPAAAADPGQAVVAIVDPLVRNVSVGLAVRVTSEGVTLARDGTVTSVVDDVVFVAVAEDDAPMVAAAAQAGLASLIFLP